MLINIATLVEPVSRGVLVDDADPDYPPLVDACDAARAQGGIVLWCHNARGMEAPVAAISENPDHATVGQFATTLDVAGAGWVAARCWGRRRTSYGHALWAHTSPVYLRDAPERATVRAAATFFVEHVNRTRAWVATRARFANAAQRERMLQLYADGRAAFERLARA